MSHVFAGGPPGRCVCGAIEGGDGSALSCPLIAPLQRPLPSLGQLRGAQQQARVARERLDSEGASWGALGAAAWVAAGLAARVAVTVAEEAGPSLAQVAVGMLRSWAEGQIAGGKR